MAGSTGTVTITENNSWGHVTQVLFTPYMPLSLMHIS